MNEVPHRPWNTGFYVADNNGKSVVTIAVLRVPDKLGTFLQEMSPTAYNDCRVQQGLTMREGW